MIGMCVADGPDRETPPAVGWGDSFLQVHRQFCCLLAADVTAAATFGSVGWMVHTPHACSAPAAQWPAAVYSQLAYCSVFTKCDQAD